MQKPPNHYAHLDGLRGFLAAIVVLSHMYLTVDLRQSSFLGPALDLIFRFFAGHYAVDYFIVLSGFCLALPFTRKEATIDGKWCVRFVWRRFLRIVLPYWAAVAFSLACIAGLIGEKTGTHWDVSIPVSARDVFAHVLLIQDFMDAVPKVNHVFWSISVEWHIYFFFPLIMLLFQRFPRDWARVGITGALVVVSFVIFKVLVPHFGTEQSMNYLGLFTLGILGCFAAYGQTLRWLPIRVWGLAFVACVILGIAIKATPLHLRVAGHNFDYLVGASAMCAMVWLAKRPDSALAHILSWKPVSWVGVFAFSTYLIHAPLIQIAWQYLFAPFQSQPVLMFWLLSTLGMGLIYGCSYLFYRLVEQPCHRLTRRF